LWTFKLLKKDKNSLVDEIEQEDLEKITEENKEKEGEAGEESNKENDENKTNENNDDNNKKEIEEYANEKTMEDMNKQNKTMNCTNFMAVMKMCGRVIINLGFIYFTQFVCVNSLVIRNSNKIDIPFLPLSLNDKSEIVRKGKFEFVNMFFQLGMFTSKTFIKLVRRIQPIEIYTIAITTITILYFMEYYSGFLPWWCFPILNYILGFFSGGTYAGGFYVILHSGQVLLDYKELTVNIAAVFNDSGTLLSCIIGWLFYNYVFNKNYPDLEGKLKCK
jgi:hypothetical protein